MKKILLLFFIFFQVCIAQSNLKIISSTPTNLTLEYSPVYTDTSEIIIDGEAYLKIDFMDASISDSNSNSKIKQLVKEFLIGVPNPDGNSILIISKEYTSLKGKLAPFSEHKKENGMLTEYYSSKSKVISRNQNVVELDESGIIKNLCVQKVKVFPILEDDSINEIKLLKKIVFSINYSNLQNQRISLKDEILKDLLINYDVAKNWAIPQHKSLNKVTSDFVLSSGSWYKIKIEEEGIYKIDKQKLASYGIDANNVDPRTIKIYNNGGYILPEEVTAVCPSDLIENSILVVGEEDGHFDNNDYILFYARGTNFWEYDSSKGKITRNKNWYSNENYYWITSGGNNGKRVENIAFSNSQTFVEQNTTPAFISHDNDEQNLLKSGKTYVGETFSSSERTQTFNNELPSIKQDSKINYNFGFIKFSNIADATVSLNIEENNQNIFSKLFDKISPSSPGYKPGTSIYNTAKYVDNLSNNTSKLKFTFNTGNSDVIGYLDYFEIEYLRDLAVNDKLIFYSDGLSNVVKYNLTQINSDKIYVFDVSNFSSLQYTELAINNNSASFKVVENSNSKYLAVTSNGFKNPPDGEAVTNNTLSKSDECEYIIITHENFKTAAERLASYRTSSSKYPVSTKVFLIDDIFNVFSAGIKDPTAIRNFIKYAYNNWSTKPNFVLLFGNGTYDILNIENKSNNYIPTFQTDNFLHDYESHPIEDYFSRINGDDKFADIAFGRLPVLSLEEANNVVDKIIYYEQSSPKGIWRNTITLVADDGIKGEGTDPANHSSQLENISRFIIPPSIIQNKIYASTYPAVLTGSGRRKPSVNESIIRAMNSGTLIMNYVGHSSKNVWADEIVFNNNTDILKIENDKYFFLISASCDYGHFDDPEFVCGPQRLITASNKGTIGSLTASREVSSFSNSALNKKFYANLFNYDDGNKILPIGLAYMKTKMIMTDDNSERFNLFCDPSLRLNLPPIVASIDSINGQSPSPELQIKALSNTSIKGKVLLSNSKVDTEFNGEALISVYDSERSIELSDVSTTMIDQGGIIFNGRASIDDGCFETEFIVPKDISYENNNGKIVVYVFNDNKEGIAYSNNFVVGGTDTTDFADEYGPEVEILFDNESSFVTRLVNPNFNLTLHLEDESGINTTGLGVGHKIEGILNGDQSNPIDLTQYFVGDVDAGGKSGSVEYNFSDLELGEYKLDIKVWDVFNNPSIEERTFTVVDDAELVIKDVYNYPNPFYQSTTFTFQHNISNEVNVKIKIYTIAGRLIKEIENEMITSKFVKIPWDGCDNDGNSIANGTYLYKLIVKSESENFSSSVLGKLSVLK